MRRSRSAGIHQRHIGQTIKNASARTRRGQYVSISSGDQSWRTWAHVIVLLFGLPLPWLRGSRPPRANRNVRTETKRRTQTQWKREKGKRRRERSALWSDAEDVCGLILPDPREKGQLSRSWSRRDTRTIHRGTPEVRSTHRSSRWQMSRASPGHPPRGPPSSLNSRHRVALLRTRDTGTSQPNPARASYPCSTRRDRSIISERVYRACVSITYLRATKFRESDVGMLMYL